MCIVMYILWCWNYFVLLIFTLRRKKRKVGCIPEWIRLDRTTLLRTLVYTYAGTEHESQDLRTRARTHHALTADAQTATAAAISDVAGWWRGSDCPPLFAVPIPFWIAGVFPSDLRDRMWSWSHILVCTVLVHQLNRWGRCKPLTLQTRIVHHSFDSVGFLRLVSTRITAKLEQWIWSKLSRL